MEIKKPALLNQQKIAEKNCGLSSCFRNQYFEIQKLTQEDFSLLAESLNIKYSVLSKIFDDFARKYIPAFEELKDDEKISKDILNSIFEVASGSIYMTLQP